MEISSKLTDLSSQDGKPIRSNVKDTHGNRGGIVLLWKLGSHPFLEHPPHTSPREQDSSILPYILAWRPVQWVKTEYFPQMSLNMFRKKL